MRYVIVGCGRAGANHSSILIEQGQEIVALVDDVPATFETFCTLVPSTATLPRFATVADCLAKKDELKIDLAVVASHTDLHAEHTLPFVQACIPCYTEKPITSNLEQAFRFVHAYRKLTEKNKKEVPVLIGLQRRFDPAILYAKSIIDSGKLGKIREIRAVLRDQYPPPPFYQGSQHSRVPLINDMAVHVIDEVAFIGGEPFHQLSCRVYKHIGYESHLNEGGDVCPGANAALITGTLGAAAGGVVFQVDASRTHSAGYCNQVEITCTDGVLHCGRYNGYNDKTAGGTQVPVEVWTSDGTKSDFLSKMFVSPYIAPPYGEFVPRFRPAFAAAHEQFRRAAVSTGAAAGTPHQGVTPGVFPCLDVLVAIDAACDSACADGKTVVVKRSDDLLEYFELCKKQGWCKGDL